MVARQVAARLDRQTQTQNRKQRAKASSQSSHLYITSRCRAEPSVGLSKRDCSSCCSGNRLSLQTSASSKDGDRNSAIARDLSKSRCKSATFIDDTILAISGDCS